MILVSKL